MDQWVNQLANITSQFKQNFAFSITIIAILWCIHLVNVLLDHRLNNLGNLPRSPRGIIGIVCSPFLHGYAAHLFFNSIPLYLLVNLMLIPGREVFYFATICIVLISGILVWIFGRKAFHIGASSVIMGYWGYVVINAYYQQTTLTILIALVCLLYLGTMFLDIIPTDKKVSWEGHLFGFIAGVITVYLLPVLPNLI